MTADCPRCHGSGNDPEDSLEAVWSEWGLVEAPVLYPCRACYQPPTEEPERGLRDPRDTYGGREIYRDANGVEHDC